MSKLTVETDKHGLVRVKVETTKSGTPVTYMAPANTGLSGQNDQAIAAIVNKINETDDVIPSDTSAENPLVNEKDLTIEKFVRKSDITASATVTDGYYMQGSGNLVPQADGKLYVLDVSDVRNVSIRAIFPNYAYSVIEFDSNDQRISATDVAADDVYKVITYNLALNENTKKIAVNTYKGFEAKIYSCDVEEVGIVDEVDNGNIAQSVSYDDMTSDAAIEEGIRYTSAGGTITNSDCKVVTFQLDSIHRSIKARMAFHPDAYSEFWLDGNNSIIKIVNRTVNSLIEFEESLPENVVFIKFNCIVESPVTIYGGVEVQNDETMFVENLAKQVCKINDSLEKTSSAFDRGHVFGNVPSVSYGCKLSDVPFGASNTSYSEVIAAFDALVDGEYVKKVNLGNSSDNQALYAYTLTPTLVSQPTGFNKKLPGVFVLCAQHGFEKGSTFGIYHFVKDIISNYDKDELLRYIRNNVNLYIVPVANPYGFDNNTYCNANDVNLNRNWDVPAWTAHNDAEDTSQNTGLQPFDQPETDAIHDFVLANKDNIDIFVDFHTNGRYNVSSVQNINWIALFDYSTYGDEYSAKLDNAYVSHAQNISLIVKDVAGSTLLGTSSDNISVCNITKETRFPEIGYSDAWAVTQGILGFTCEGFNAFPAGSSFVDEEKIAMADIIASMIQHCLYSLSR